MNLNMQKLMNISKSLRLFILLALTAVIIYLVYGYLVNDEFLMSQGENYAALWGASSANKYLLFAIKAPLFCILILGVFWLQKLLSYYQQGLFFDESAMRCYLWLVWLKVSNFFIKIIEEIVTGLYHSEIFGADNTDVEIQINFSEFTTILLMLVIVYLLKAAKQIEAENKEFI